MPQRPADILSLFCKRFNRTRIAAQEAGANPVRGDLAKRSR